MTKSLAVFASGQVALQALQLFAGLIIIRSWSVELYAAWAVLAAIQATANALADVGARDGVVALSRAGSTGGLPLPSLIAEALRLRRRHLLLLTPVVAVYLLWLARGGVLPDDGLVTIIVLTMLTAYVSAWVPYYGLPLLFARDMRRFYGPQLAGAGARLTLIAIAFATGTASLTMLLLITLTTSAATGAYFRWRCERLHPSATGTPEARRALKKYAYAFAPAAIYMAFQDQISIFLLSSIGNVGAISETAAIGRLAMIFQVFLAMNTVLVQPWIARASAELVVFRIAAFAALALALGGGLVLLTLLRPDVPLLLLGASYDHAEHEMLLAAIATALFYAANAFYCVNVARGWVWAWTGTAYTVAMGVAQACAIMGLGIRSSADAFHIVIVMSATGLIFHLAHCVAGMARLRVGQAANG